MTTKYNEDYPRFGTTEGGWSKAPRQEAGVGRSDVDYVMEVRREARENWGMLEVDDR